MDWHARHAANQRLLRPVGEKTIYVTEYEKGTVERYDVDAEGYKLFG